MKKEVKLNRGLPYLLEECRMVLPASRRFFGFQLITVPPRASTKALTAEQLLFVALFWWRCRQRWS